MSDERLTKEELFEQLVQARIKIFSLQTDNVALCDDCGNHKKTVQLYSKNYCYDCLCKIRDRIDFLKGQVGDLDKACKQLKAKNAKLEAALKKLSNKDDWEWDPEGECIVWLGAGEPQKIAAEALGIKVKK